MLTDMGDAAVERHIIACVNESLSLYLMSNARFMCERLVAEFPSEVSHAAAYHIIGLQVQSCTCMHECVICSLTYLVSATFLRPSAGKHVPAGNVLLQIRSGPSCLSSADG